MFWGLGFRVWVPRQRLSDHPAAFERTCFIYDSQGRVQDLESSLNTLKSLYNVPSLLGSGPETWNL